MYSTLFSRLIFLSVCLACLPFAGPGFHAVAGAVEGSLAGAASSPPLSIVFLEAKEPIPPDRKIPCRIGIESPNKSQSSTNLPAVARLHGATSQAYPKKSYGITLDSTAALLGMRNSPHWVLNAAYIDRSLMRHKLAYDLFRSLSTPAAPKFASASEFVEVQVNGGYQGVYLLMERVDRQLLGLRLFHSNEASHACIYKAVDHAANFGQAGHGGFEQREPDPLLAPYWQPLDDFTRFVSATSNAEFFDVKTGIASRLDLENAIDFHLLVLLTSNMDGITKNYILARDAQLPGSPAPRFFFVPWDYDATFGRNWNAAPVGTDAWLSNALFDRLLGDATYRAKFVKRWGKLREGLFATPLVQGMIDGNARRLGSAAIRNAARWPVTDGWYPDHTGCAEDIAQMHTWVEGRVKWLDQEISQRTK